MAAQVEVAVKELRRAKPDLPIAVAGEQHDLTQAWNNPLFVDYFRSSLRWKH
jgi:hypothetical protein